MLNFRFAVFVGMLAFSVSVSLAGDITPTPGSSPSTTMPEEHHGSVASVSNETNHANDLIGLVGQNTSISPSTNSSPQNGQENQPAAPAPPSGLSQNANTATPTGVQQNPVDIQIEKQKEVIAALEKELDAAGKETFELWKIYIQDLDKFIQQATNGAPYLSVEETQELEDQFDATNPPYLTDPLREYRTEIEQQFLDALDKLKELESNKETGQSEG